MPRSVPRTSHARESALKAWVEELALLLERDGLARTAGRIFGWLLVCHPAEQGLPELARALGASKGGVSTMARLLRQAGLVERLRLPGARRDVYRIRPDQWESIWQARIAWMSAVSAQLKRGKALLKGEPAERRARLDGLAAEYARAEQVVPLLVRGPERSAAEQPVRAAPARDGKRRGA